MPKTTVERNSTMTSIRIEKSTIDQIYQLEKCLGFASRDAVMELAIRDLAVRLLDPKFKIKDIEFSRSGPVQIFGTRLSGVGRDLIDHLQDKLGLSGRGPIIMLAVQLLFDKWSAVMPTMVEEITNLQLSHNLVKKVQSAARIRGNKPKVKKTAEPEEPGDTDQEPTPEPEPEPGLDQARN